MAPCGRWVLGGILVVALALRLWHLDHGLPYAYNADEAEHFVPEGGRDVRAAGSTRATSRTRLR